MFLWKRSRPRLQFCLVATLDIGGVRLRGLRRDADSRADAIRAAESDLVKVAERDQVVLGGAWCQVARLAVHVATGTRPDHLDGVKAQWKDASTPTKAANAQSVMALVSSGVLPARSAVTYELLGYDATTIRRLLADAERDEAVDELASLLTPTQRVQPESTDQQADALAARVDTGG